MPEIVAYAFEPEDMAKLRLILTRLYSPESASADVRRDLANAMDAILAQAVALESGARL